MVGESRKKWLAALWSWTVDKAIENWPAILAFFVIGGGSAYVAAVSAWLKGYGPPAWIAAGLCALLVAAAIALVYGKVAEKRAIAEYFRSAAKTHSVNTLAKEHSRESIRLVDFYHPFFVPTEHARFEECELFGPAAVGAQGCTFDRCEFVDCEVVIVRSDFPIQSSMVFRFCTFLRCKLFRVTFFMTKEAYELWPGKARMPVISDTTANIKSPV